MHRRRRTALVLSAAIVAAAPLLTGCGSDAHPGAAAVVDGRRITVAQLEGRVNEVRSAQRAASKDDAQYEQVIANSGTLTRDTLHGMVLDRVLDRAAKNAGVTVTRKDSQQMRSALEQQAGGSKALETAWLANYGVAPKRLDDSLRTEIEARKLAAALGVDMNTTDGKATFWKAMSTASKQLHVDLNPRYGAWDVQKSSRVDAKTPWLRDVSSVGTQQQPA
ncbi:SurA N-terminal domain-containing protein [Streptomyces sp. NPDC054766]|uniref:SurA N-terminal domain-containing protein n=1 Tax=Streptomyces rhizosphaerihabitans TaxID=1266770 RepID=UPI0021C0AB08|nr:SurA N-terminal domain-containing protein [Streptomyces rhizosphaerihabitans]MCT9005591.1 SurA N-terminal domain-containing protein [Streptomyces rhizosphaerihabitans]